MATASQPAAASPSWPPTQLVLTLFLKLQDLWHLLNLSLYNTATKILKIG